MSNPQSQTTPASILGLERKARSASERSGEARRAWSGGTKKFREPGHRGGSSTSTANFTVSGGTLAISGSGSIAPATGAALTLGASSSFGTFLYDSSATSAFGAINDGTGGTNNSGFFTQTNGIINATSLTLGGGNSGGFGGTATLGNASGNGAALNVSGDVQVGASGAFNSVVTVNTTGTLNVTGNLRIATSGNRDATGTVNQSGGVVSAASLNLSGTFGDTTSRLHTSVYNLNGGELKVGSIAVGTVTTSGTTNATVNFNGGTLKPTVSSTNFWANGNNVISGSSRVIVTATVKAGGAKIDTNGFDITIAQPLQSGTTGDGSLIKSGSGTLTLAGANTYTGATNIVAGRLALSGSLTSDVAVNGGSLFAIGAPVTTGSVTINSGGHFEVQINGLAAGTQYCQLNVGGGVSLNGTLDISAVAGLSAGSSFTIVNKTSAGPVVGAFFGKPEGSVFSASGYNWIISYAGGSGNDVVLTIATPQQSWRYQYFGTIANTGTAADTFDADKDGESNYLEFATGQNPNAGTLLPMLLARNGTNLEFTYTRSDAAIAGGVTFLVEWSDTLAPNSWSSSGVSETILTDNGTVQTLKATVPAGGGGKRFVRLKIVKP